MPIVKDSTEVKTVIPYCKKDKIVAVHITETIVERKALEGKILYSPSYEPILLSATVLSLVLLFWTYLYYKRHREILLFDYFKFRQTEKKHIHVNPLGIILDLLGLVVVCSLGYYFLSVHSSYSGWEVFIWILGGSLFLFLLRIFLIFLTGYLTGNKKLATKHFRLHYFSTKLIAIVLLPILLVALLIPDKGYLIVFWTVLFVFAFRTIAFLFFISRFLRFAGFSIFHSFLYLCTLELLPFLYIAMFIEFLIYK